jgi:hypothetical protein
LDVLYEDRLDGRISVHQYDKMQQEASNEQKIIAKKLEDFEEDYLAILEKGIDILGLSQKATAIYQSKKDDDRRAILRDLFSNIRLNGNLIEVERTPLVAAIANKVRKEKELRNTFEQAINNKLTEEEFVNGTLSPLWLGIRDSNRLHSLIACIAAESGYQQRSKIRNRSCAAHSLIVIRSNLGHNLTNLVIFLNTLTRIPPLSRNDPVFKLLFRNKIVIKI